MNCVVRGDTSHKQGSLAIRRQQIHRLHPVRRQKRPTREIPALQRSVQHVHDLHASSIPKGRALHMHMHVYINYNSAAITAAIAAAAADDDDDDADDYGSNDVVCFRPATCDMV